MKQTVLIECIYDNMPIYSKDCAIVVIDVIRAATTAITGVVLGRKCYPVSSIEMVTSLKKKLDNPLLVGELGGNMPYGFHLNNSPAKLESRADLDRPMILLSTGGSRLIYDSRIYKASYISCLRNYGALINHLRACHPKVALISPATRGEFRDEDQLCCSWIAEGLIRHGYHPQDEKTNSAVNRWKGVPVHAIANGKSAAYLRDTGQEEDLEFILTHVNDLNKIYRIENNYIIESDVSQIVMTNDHGNQT